MRDVQTVYARKALTVGKPKVVKLYATADNYFTVSVNGTKVGGTVPVSTDDFVWAKIHEFDITSLLKPGANEIAIAAVNAGGQAGLLCRVQVDGKPVLFSDHTWKVTDVPPKDSWTSGDFNDSGWQDASELGPASMSPWGSRLAGWPAELATQPAYLYHLPIAPVQISYAPDVNHLSWLPATKHVRMGRPVGVSGPWKLILDFGKELTGRAIVTGYHGPFEIDPGESTGEAIEKPYVTSNSSPSPYSAFRYVVLSFPATVDKFEGDVTLDHLYYPVEYKGSFDCSDPLLTQVWYTGAYTAHLCMQEDIWDAPKRDRVRWMGDLHVSGEVINNVFADQFLMEQTMQRLRNDAQRGHKPSELPGANVNDIPGYTCAWIAGMADLYRHIGNRAYIESQHQALLTMLAFMQQDFDSNGVFANNHRQWPFVDWAPLFNGDTPQARAATHLFMVKAAREAVFLLNKLGDSANAAKYNQWAEDLTATAQKYLVTDGTFGDRRQENSMAIYSGVATPSQVSSIYDRVLKPGTPAWGITTSPYYSNYVLLALSQAGHTQDATNYVRSFWGGMLAEGATSWWEGYDPTWEKNNFHAHLQADDGTGYFVSLCHGWSAGPTSFLTERVLGVRSTGGGFKTCEIAPDLGDLAWASGAAPTPGGPLKVNVEKSGSSITVTVEVPKGVSAKVTPGGTITKIDGKAGAGVSTVLGAGKHVVSSE